MFSLTLSDKTKSILRKSPATLCVALSVALFFPPVVHSTGELSYAEEIRRCVVEDKVYLLQNIRQKVSLPAEKLVIDALLSEDGPQAITLYQKQLTNYPDPVLDQISNSRIAAYSMATTTALPLPPVIIPNTASKVYTKQTTPVTTPAVAKPIVATPQKEVIVKKAETPPIVTIKKEPVAVENKPFALQCGSFKSKENADALVKKISLTAPAKVIQAGEFYKVRLKATYTTKEEAQKAAQKLPFEAVAVPNI